jgi:hypothetical protein
VDVANTSNPDTVAAFTADCEKSSLGGGKGAATGATMGGGGGGDKEAGTAAGDLWDKDGGPSPESVEHIPVLTAGSVETLQWFRNRVVGRCKLTPC